MRPSQTTFTLVALQVNDPGAVRLKNSYIIVEREQIVAEDLAHAIRAYDAQAQVVVFRSSDDALSALAGLRPRAVLLHHEPTGAANPVRIALRDMGVPYAVTGPLTDGAPGDAPVLASPFNEITVATLLRQMLEHSCGTAD